MNVGSLFSGIGGIDLGLERAGHRVVFQCESDGWRRDVLRERFPGVPVYDDVGVVGRGVERGRLRGGESDSANAEPRRARPVGLLCGGFPCQDLSVAGRRAGLMHEGGRSNLFFEFARIADELIRPGGYVLVENVPGLLSSNNGRDFAVVLATLAELGFHDLAWRVLDSRHFGVPQRRRRVFVVGRRARGSRCAEILLEPESGGGYFAPRREAGTDVAGTLGTRSGGGRTTDLDNHGAYVTALTTRSGNTQDDQQSTQLVAGPLDTRQTPHGHGMAGVNDQQAFNNHIVADTPAYALRKDPGGTRQGHNTNYVVADTLTSGSHPGSNMPGRRREDDTNIVAIAENMRHELRETDYTNALAGGGGKPGQGYQMARIGSAVRRLTPVECERLQGFPDNWTRLDDKTPDSRRYAALGDAVTVNVAEWIGHRLMQHVQKVAA